MAIAYDASASGENTGTSLTVAHTTGSGDDRFLIVGVYSGGGDYVTGVTYDSSSMTQMLKRNDVASQYFYIYGIAAPSTGNNDIVVSASSSTDLKAGSASYTGVDAASTTPDATAGKQVANPGTSDSLDITTSTDNAWAIGWVRADNGGVSAGSGETSRVIFESTDRCMVFDTDGVITPAGTETLNINMNTGSNGSLIAVAITPTAAYTLTAGTGAFTLTGVAALFNLGYTLAATVGEFVLTGVNAALNVAGVVWTKATKNSTSWTDDTKNATVWSGDSKNSTSWSDGTKNSTAWTGDSVNSTSWTNDAKN